MTRPWKLDEEHEDNIEKTRMREADKIVQRYQAEEGSQKKQLRKLAKKPSYYYNKAQNSGSVEDLQAFKKSFPNSNLANEATDEIKSLKKQRKEAALRKNRAQYGKLLIDPRDGQSYKTVKIGSYFFMAENLNYKMKGSYKTGIATDNPKIYGRLYTFEAAQKACPLGWELGSAYLWAALFGDIDFIFAMRVGVDVDGRMGTLLKSKKGWKSYNQEVVGYDSYGFRALPVGTGSLKTGKYYNIGHIASFWTSTTTTFSNQIGLAVEFSSRSSDFDTKQRNKNSFLAACRCYTESWPINPNKSKQNGLKKKKGETTKPAAQEKDSEAEKENAFVANPPKLIGGQAGLYQKIVYPEVAKGANIQGQVVVQFTVDKEGNVVNPKVIKGIGGGCDQEALRVIKEAKFLPGTQKGKPVNVKLSLAINFRLAD